MNRNKPTAVLLAALVQACAAAACAAESARPPAGPTARALLSASGRVEPAGEERNLQFELPGRVVRVAVKCGGAVDRRARS